MRSANAAVVELVVVGLLALASGVARADAFLAAEGGSGGGQFQLPCPPGQNLTGFELRVGDDVDAIRSVCVLSYGPTEISSPTLTTDSGLVPVPGAWLKGLTPQQVAAGWSGGAGGGVQRLLCPESTPIVIGIDVAAEGVDTIVVNNIHVYCGKAITAQTAASQPSAIFDGPGYKPSPGWLGIGVGGALAKKNRGYQRCPAGQVAIGTHGRSGKWLDAVGLICGEPRVIEKPTPPAKPELGSGRWRGFGPLLQPTDAGGFYWGLAVKWKAAPRETSAAVSSYSVLLWNQKTWSTPLQVDVGRPYATTLGPKHVAEKRRYAVKVCAENLFFSACSPETWYIGDPVTKRTAIEIGHSATQAAQAEEPIKTLGRVPVSPNSDPRSICERARDARARRSVAAPNLAAQCRAQGGEVPP